MNHAQHDERAERDITERKRSEGQMRHMATVVQDSNHAITVQDHQGVVVAWNHGAEALYGYSESEAIGMSSMDMVPENLRSEAQSFLTDIRNGELVDSIETKRIAKDGRLIDVFLTVTVLKDDDGNPTEIATTERDITNTREMEREYNNLASEFESDYRRLAAILRDSNDSIIVHDSDRRIVTWNRTASRMLGYSEAEALCMTMDELIPECSFSSELSEYERCRDHGESVSFESKRITQDGRIIDVWVTASAGAKGDKNTQWLCTTERDITERAALLQQKNKELESLVERVESANMAKSNFLANMSHEIRTPMTAILGFAENMLEVDQSHADRLKCIQIILRNGNYLLDLINDILDLSKIESGKMEVVRSECQPCCIIAELASLMHVRTDAKGLQFKIEYIGAIPKTIQSNAACLRQILINLVGNAIKFTEVGIIKLVTQFVDCGGTSYLQFEVVDTGCGMTQEQVGNMFQPFMQADNSTTRKFGGTGLGLTISKRFAELLGGNIIVTTSELGVGTTIRVTILVESVDGVTMLDDPISATVIDSPEDTGLQTAPPSLHGIRILLAEDGPDNQRLISFVLKKAGADVTVMENGKIAMDAALAARDKGKPFDLILMDMQMPVMDGYKATGQLRRMDYAGLIIALTAHAMDGDRDKCIKAGCDDYATKPIDRNALIDLILRRVQGGQPQAVAVQTETPKRPALHGCRILLAEDNPTNQILVVGILEKAGAEVTTVKDGRLALDAALAAREDANPFDIILMDIQMPLMSGDEATKLLHEKGYTGKIIALTAYTTDGDQQRFINMGFDDSACKPVNRTKLIESIQRQLVGAEPVPTTATSIAATCS